MWLYHCFSLSLRDIEAILAARGVAVSYERIREYGLRFGRLFASTLERRRPRPGDKWLMDEEFKRRIKAQTVLPSAETAAMLFWALLVSGQITMRKVDG